MSKEIIQQNEHAPAAPSPIDQILRLTEAGVTTDQLSEMLKLQKEHEAMVAKREFNDAVAAFKSESIIISKDKTVSYKTGSGRTEYKHSSLANVIETVMPHLSKYGLSHKWLTEQKDGTIRVTCVLSHRAGHSEQTSLESSPDNSGGKNPIQAIASAVKYLERYTLTALLGLAEKDQFDDDGRATSAKTINETEAKHIKQLMSKANANEKFLKYFGCERVEDIPAEFHAKAVSMLERRISNMEAKANDKA